MASDSRGMYQLYPPSPYRVGGGEAVLIRMLLSPSNRNSVQRGLDMEGNEFSPRIPKSSVITG